MRPRRSCLLERQGMHSPGSTLRGTPVYSIDTEVTSSTITVAILGASLRSTKRQRYGTRGEGMELLMFPVHNPCVCFCSRGKAEEEECNCYGAGLDGECCRTCADVKAAYRRKGWRLNPAAVPPVSCSSSVVVVVVVVVFASAVKLIPVASLRPP